MNKISIIFLSIVSTVLIYGVEIKINVPETKSGEIKNASAKDFMDGKLFYDAIPSAPAGSATAVKVIETDDHTDFICKIYQLKTKGIAAEVASFLRTTVNKEQGSIDVSVNTKQE